MNTRITTIVAGLAFAALALTGCAANKAAGSDPTATKSSQKATKASAKPWTRAQCGKADEIEWMDHDCDTVMKPKTYKHDASKNEPIKYDGGVTVRLARAEIRPATESSMGIPPGQKIVRVVTKFANRGDEPQPLPDGDSQLMTLLYGVDMAEAEPEPGDFDGDLQTDSLPRQISPGRTVEYVESFAVPANELGHLTVETTFYDDTEGDVHQFTHVKAVK